MQADWGGKHSKEESPQMFYAEKMVVVEREIEEDASEGG